MLKVRLEVRSTKKNWQCTLVLRAGPTYPRCLEPAPGDYTQLSSVSVHKLLSIDLICGPSPWSQSVQKLIYHADNTT